jgi:hypothetical protein
MFESKAGSIMCEALLHKALRINARGHHDIWHNDIRHNDTYLKDTQLIDIQHYDYTGQQ